MNKSISLTKGLATLFGVIAFTSFSFYNAKAQVIGNVEVGSQVPKEVSPAKIENGSLSEGANLFTGTYQTGYSLGTVSTPSGLSYSLNLSYSSVSSGGDNAPVASGIPYGEGWSLNIPTITISSADFVNYKKSEISEIYDEKPGTLQDQAYVDRIFSEKYTKEDLRKQAKLYWYAPQISIPGVVSDRFVFKYVKDGEAVFVPNAFEQYVEARFNGSRWKVIAPDGTIYTFDLVSLGYRPANGIRPNNSSEHPRDYLDSVFVGTTKHFVKRVVNGVEESFSVELPKSTKDFLFPKEEVLSWHCTFINNPQHSASQSIGFEYQRFGKFDYFKQFSQGANPNGTRLTRGLNLMLAATANGGSYVDSFATYRDLILTRVVSSDLANEFNELKLNYKTLLRDSSNMGLGGIERTKNMLLLGAQGVASLDSMYNYSSIYKYGGSVQFSNWKRFRHPKQIPGGSSYSITSTNPYIGNGTYYKEAAIPNNDNQISFNHGFLESENLISTLNLVGGDIYEIKTHLRDELGLRAPSSNGIYARSRVNSPLMDINLVAGKSSNSIIQTSPFVTVIEFNNSRSKNIFTTFNSAIKWGFEAQNSTTDAYTSNFFQAPNLNTDYQYMALQVGPANADIKFDADGEDIATSDVNGKFTLKTHKSYIQNYIQDKKI